MVTAIRLMAAGDILKQLDAAIAMCQSQLAENSYVRDIATDTRAGKWEYRIKVRDDAKTMGVLLADVAGTVRASYYGEEVQCFRHRGVGRRGGERIDRIGGFYLKKELPMDCRSTKPLSTAGFDVFA